MRPWTTSEVRQLEYLYREGLTLADIGTLLERGSRHSENARGKTIARAIECYGVRSRLGGRRRNFTEDELARLERMYAQGDPLVKIARMLGRSERTVSNALTKYGIRQRVGRRKQ